MSNNFVHVEFSNLDIAGEGNTSLLVFSPTVLSSTLNLDPNTQHTSAAAEEDGVVTLHNVGDSGAWYAIANDVEDLDTSAASSSRRYLRAGSFITLACLTGAIVAVQGA